MKGLWVAGGVGLRGLRDARGARPRPGSPGRAVPRAAASSCGRGRTSGRGGAGRGGGAVTPAGPARSIPQPVRAASRAEPSRTKPSRADTMPKCPRCQKEVYFGKGFPLPPRPPPARGDRRAVGLLKPGCPGAAPCRISGRRGTPVLTGPCAPRRRWSWVAPRCVPQRCKFLGRPKVA